MSEQMDLMAMEDYPEMPEVLEALAARPVRRWMHTGQRFFKKMCADSDLAEQVYTGLSSGYSVRLLARRLGVSPKTLAACRRLLTERGELAPVRRRVDALLDDFVEEGIEYALEGMRLGVTHPSSLSIPVLAGYDKMAQRDAGLVAGTERTEEDITVERIEARLQILRRATEEASRRDSTASGCYGHYAAVDTAVDTGRDAGTTRPEAGPAALLGPGGGDRPAAAAPIVDGSGVEIGGDKRG